MKKAPILSAGIFLLLFIKGGCAAPLGPGEGSAGRHVKTLQPPGRDMYARLDPKGISVLPSGRWVKPAGESVSIEHDPFGLALSPDGQTILTVHDEVLTVIPAADLQAAARFPSLDKKTPGPFANGSFMGAAVAGDSQTAYLSGGNDGDVIIFDLKMRLRTGAISLNVEIEGRKFAGSFTGDLALSPDSKRLYALDQFNFRMVEIDTAAQKIV